MLFTCVGLHNMIRVWQRSDEWAAGVAWSPAETPQGPADPVIGAAEGEFDFAAPAAGPGIIHNHVVYDPRGADMTYEGVAGEEETDEFWLWPVRRCADGTTIPIPEIDDFSGMGNVRFQRPTIVNPTEDAAVTTGLTKRRLDELVELYTESDAGYRKLQNQLVTHFKYRKTIERTHAAFGDPQGPRPGGVRWLRSQEDRTAQAAGAFATAAAAAPPPSSS